MMAKPPTNSLVSAKGPSVTLNFPSESRTRAPAELGRQPSVATSQPDFMPSSTSFPIFVISSWVGGRSGLPGLYKHKNRIVRFLSGSTDRSNKGGRDRRRQHFSAKLILRRELFLVCPLLLDTGNYPKQPGKKLHDRSSNMPVTEPEDT